MKPTPMKGLAMSKHHQPPKTTVNDVLIAVVTVPLFVVWSLFGN